MSDTHIAVFIDVENLTHWLKNKGLKKLMAELSATGQVIIRKAYGNWCNQNIHNFQEDLNRQGFELIHNYHPVSGKNSSDIHFAIDVMECALESFDIDCFVLATGDSDFSPLFRRLRAKNREVVGVGPRSPLSESVKSSCSKYIFTNEEKNLPTPSLPTAKEPAIPAKPEPQYPASALEEYHEALRKTKWPFVDEQTLDLAYWQLSLLPALPKVDLAAHITKANSGKVSSDEAECVVKLLFKSHLFLCERKNSNGENLFRINKQRHYLRDIDTAMISRILLYCINQDKKPDKSAIKQIIYGHYITSTFDEMMEVAKGRIP